MTDDMQDTGNSVASRRAVLKGAVGAGVAAAAWSAPKVGSIPAYALTTSTGVFNGVAYYLAFNWRVRNNQPDVVRWQRGRSTSPASDQGRADNITRTTNTLATYTWSGIFPDGSSLIVEAAGDPRPIADGGDGSATITLIQAPPGCVFELSEPNPTARETGDYSVNIPAGTFDPTGVPQSATYSLNSGTEIVMSGVQSDSRNNVIMFNINCD